MKKLDQKLKQFTEKLKKIPEIIAVYYAGSLGGGTMDKYSDLDIDIVVKDKDYKKITKKIKKLSSFFGEIKLYYPFAAYVENDYLKVELEPIKKSSLKPDFFLKHVKIIFDREGTLTKLYKKAQRAKIKINHGNTVDTFKTLIDDQIYTARHTARGWKFDAMEEANWHSKELFLLLARLKGYDQWGLRRAEEILSKNELKMFKNTVCTSPKTQNIKKSMKANWKFMKYVKDQYEKKTNKKIDLKVNEKEILRIVDKIYKEAK